MKIIGVSDLHGYLPNIQKCDVLCICGDILPLDIQRDFIKSIVWLSKDFTKWIENVPCKKVILIAGNHDFVFEKIVTVSRGTSRVNSGKSYWEAYAPTLITDELMFRNVRNSDGEEKLIYLQDSNYVYNGVKFYGTPWCPDLRNWAFYKNSDDLTKKFNEIPNNVDVLLTHTPGSDMFGTETSFLGYGETRSFGSAELSAAVITRPKIKLWMCGHIHTGNHNVSEMESGTKVVNVSYIDESYNPMYNPLEIEI